MDHHVLGVSGNRLTMDGDSFQAVGLRCSNAMIDDEAVDQLVTNLAVFQSYGVNSISVFVQGSRFGDVRGYREDGTLDPIYAARLDRILAAADQAGILVVVGCLYWGASRARWESWTQSEANAAVANTARWLDERGWRHVIIDVDNEGMAQRTAGFDNRRLVLAAKAAAPNVLVATNCHGEPPAEADLGIHFAAHVPGKPYIETEGSPHAVDGGYWGPYSKREGLYGYVNVGIYTPKMKADQCRIAEEHLARGDGYFLASTWLQAPRPQGPNQAPGGMGTAEDPGVRWWLEWLKTYLKQ